MRGRYPNSIMMHEHFYTLEVEIKFLCLFLYVVIWSTSLMLFYQKCDRWKVASAKVLKQAPLSSVQGVHRHTYLCASSCAYPPIVYSTHHNTCSLNPLARSALGSPGRRLDFAGGSSSRARRLAPSGGSSRRDSGFLSRYTFWRM
jgi:hypothetical protein